MTKLAKPIRATLVHGKTGQEMEHTSVDAGTEYTLEGQSETAGGGVLSTILVDGYRYRTYELDSVPCAEDGAPLVAESA